MLEGVIPFPPEFAARYRERGYWRDKSLAEEFHAVFERWTDRVAVIDRERSITYRELDLLSGNLALNLYEAGLRPLDSVVVQLPNVAEFVILYFALQKIGCIPIAALASHRFAEIEQFVALSGAIACVIPGPTRDFNYARMVSRIGVRMGIILASEIPDGFLSVSELIERPATLDPAILTEIPIDPTDPAIFQLSGGTTGIPKLIPRTHNDYAYNLTRRRCGLRTASRFRAAHRPPHRAQSAARMSRDSGLPVPRGDGSGIHQHSPGRYVSVDREAPRHTLESRAGPAHPAPQ